MRRVLALVFTAVLILTIGIPGAAGAHPRPSPRPGAPGIGDLYFPTDGNGGYDVGHYDLDIAYDPPTDRLRGRATISARTTHALSAFNLDLNGLTVTSVRVDGRPARWRHVGDELTVIPRRALAKRARFHVVVTYGGVPLVLDEPALGRAGVFPTDDGALIVGQPHVADTWFPVNDHPLDKASYRFRVTVPRGLEAVANGRLAGVRRHGRTQTWTWVARDPMASYLATATVGQFNLDHRRVAGIDYWDAIDPVLYEQPEPRTGERYAINGGENSAYQRLSRVIDVPAAGGELSFHVARDTEPGWDHFFVEARPVGTEDWTTLPDANGHTTREVGNACPGWLTLHPFLTHYQTDDGAGGCTAEGTTGEWHAVSGASDGYEQWRLDLSAYAGRSVEVALSVVGDESVAYNGVYVDDVVAPGGAGSTSFEADADPLDGWAATGAPAGSPGNASDWRTATESAGPSTGENAEEALAREPEIIDFLDDILGPYPFGESGGIVDDDPGLGFALENQTRPIYAQGWFTSPGDNTSVVVHELAHQWTGDDLALEAWQHIWLNEGFASYMEWLWSQDGGGASAQEIFDFYAAIPADDPFWATVIGDPGPEHIFDGPVYDRGAMALHALRLEIGDGDFFRLLRRWTAMQAGGNVRTDEFTSLAERVSGEDLDAFFTAWLFTPEKPAGLPEAAALRGSPSGDLAKQLARPEVHR
ncbi:immune inhibitor A [Aeromicrobium sp. Marseille-Q0843]|uniref:Immune inhibitor A n=1 Tax=Aeromicrobium phoceense TaxID=2754045 RepID=A0A838XJ97_9ACTN|nr:M1 family metallopeptidase [Aeromicrobium phoceense]MBA4609081.1 immune inhibitor A [Aeromicrobium phoceense]